MAYNINITSSTLTSTELYEGRVVYFDTDNILPDLDPNNVGILELSRNIPGADGVWTAVINGIRYNFNANGAQVQSGVYDNTPVLYGVVNSNSIEPTIHNSTTRGGGQGESNTVSVSYMIPKDYFACHALNALIQKIDNPLGMSNGTIALLAAKCYKIAEAMSIEAYNSRENDKASSSYGDYVDVDPTSLQSNTERILYNINESIIANTLSNKNDGIIISNIDKIKFDGTPDVNIANTTSNPVNTKKVTP